MKPTILVTLLLTATVLTSAQGQPATTPSSTKDAPAPIPPEVKLTAEQTDAIMKQLNALEGVVGKSRGDILGGAMARCSKAVAGGELGALQLYLDCYKLEHFDRVNLKLTDYQDWAKRNVDKHKDPEFLKALWLQLEYLVLSIQAQDVQDKDMATLVASLQKHVATVVSAIAAATKHTAAGAVKDNTKGGRVSGRSFDSGNLQQMLRLSVKISEFAKAFLLEEFLKKEEWTYDPLDFKGMYDLVIFPYYAEKKPAELPALWDNRIKAELDIRAAVMSDTEYAVYYKEHYPSLLWKKADFLVTHNVNAVAAISDMLKLIRENPTHPEATDWTKRLRDIVNQAQPPLPPSGAPVSAPATN
jgi:hypothetical protein